MNNQTFEFDEHKDYLRLLLSEKNASELRIQLNEMEDFDVATFLTDLREDGDQLMVLTYLMLSKEKGADVFAELEPPEQELIPFLIHSLVPLLKKCTWTTQQT